MKGSFIYFVITLLSEGRVEEVGGLRVFKSFILMALRAKKAKQERSGGERFKNALNITEHKSQASN